MGLCVNLIGRFYIAKGLLPYYGLGSGIKRALDEWSEIDFADDREGCLFTATVHRKSVAKMELVDVTPNVPGKVPGKTSGEIVELMKENAFITIPELVEKTGVTERSVERNIQKLQDSGIVRRVGSAKDGHWEVLE